MLVSAAVLVTVAAAVRSTWSPCGESMLSTLTPLGEQSRRARFASTAAWFVAGSLLGGAALGLLGASLAAAASALGAGHGPIAGTLAAGLLVASGLVDLALAGRRAVGHHRQVNERWLDHFRPWVYGAGFGFQIGCGLATYVTTAAVYLVVVLGALTASPALALSLGLAFGLIRGLAVLLGRSLTSNEALRRFHARFHRLEPASRALVVLVALGGASLVLAGGPQANAWAAAGLGALALAVAALMWARSPWRGRRWARRSRPAEA